MSSMSTVNPPLTLPLMTPLTLSLPSKAFSRRRHAWARFAFSRERRVSPKPSSTASRATSTSSPTATVNVPVSSRNWLAGMAESDFRPALTITTSGPISTTRPVSSEPGRICCPARLSSNISAKFSSDPLMCPH